MAGVAPRLNRLAVIFRGVAIALALVMPRTETASAQTCGYCSGSLTASGNNALEVTSGANNSAFGDSALQSDSTGAANTAVGTDALILNTKGSSNTAMGYGAMYNNDGGSNNTAVGVG